MKSFIFVALFVAIAAAAPATDESQAVIISQENSNIGVDGFKTGYQTSNGISADAEGRLINAGTENEAVVVRGAYSYTGPDGVVYTVEYIADENGFQPRGAHLPVPPQ